MHIPKLLRAVVRLIVKPEWNYDMSAAPRDGSLLLLLIAAGEERENPLDDTPSVSRAVGFNNFEHDNEDRWQLSGWCWLRDHFTAGYGVPIAWMRYPSIEG